MTPKIAKRRSLIRESFFFLLNVGQDDFLILANVEKLSEMIFGCFLISRTMSGTCFGQDLAKKP